MNYKDAMDLALSLECAAIDAIPPSFPWDSVALLKAAAGIYRCLHEHQRASEVLRWARKLHGEEVMHSITHRMWNQPAARQAAIAALPDAYFPVMWKERCCNSLPRDFSTALVAPERFGRWWRDWYAPAV